MLSCRECGTRVESATPVTTAKSSSNPEIKSDGKLRANCPHCDKRIKAPIQAAGKKVRCPKCSKSVQLPEVTAEQRELYESSQLLENLTESKSSFQFSGDETSFEINLPLESDTSVPPTRKTEESSEPTSARSNAEPSSQSNVSGKSSASVKLPTASVIQAECSACGAEVSAPLQFIGLTIPCEQCGAAVKFPDRLDDSNESMSSRSRDTSPDVRVRREIQLLRAIDMMLEETGNPPVLEPLQFNDPLSASVIRRHVATITKAIKANSSEVSEPAQEALTALATHRAADANEELFPLLKQSSGAFRLELLSCLAELRHPELLPSLLKALGASRGPEVKIVVEATLRYGDPRAILPLLYAADVHRQLVRTIYDGIVGMGAAAGNQLCRLVPKIDDSTTLTVIADLLGRFEGGCPIKTFRLLLKNDDVMVRRETARSLAKLADGASIPQLVRSMRDSDEEVRALLAQAFPRCANEEAISGLMKYVDDPSPKVRCSVIRALGESGLIIPLPLIRPHLKDEDLDCRIASAEAIGRLGDPNGLTFLLDMLREADVERNPALPRKIAASLGRMKDARATLPLLNLLVTDDVQLKVQIARSLGDLGQKAAREPLERLLSHEPSEPVRIAAARSLGELGDPEARSALALTLRDTSSVQVVAIQALAKLKGRKRDIVDAVRELLQSPNAAVRREVLTAYGRAEDPELISEVIPLLADKDAEVRTVALQTIRQLGDARPNSELLKLAGSPQPGTTSPSKGKGTSLKLPSLSVPNWIKSVSPAALVGLFANPVVLGGLSVCLVIGLTAFFWTNPFGIKSQPVLPRGYVGQVSVSEDGKWLAAARSRGLLEIWDVQQQKVVSQNSELRPKFICFGPQGKNLLCAAGKRMALIPLTNGQLGEPVDVKGHDGAVADLQVTPDHKFAVTLGSDRTIVRWDLEKGVPAGAIQPDDSIDYVAISSDGHEVAGASKGGKVYLWDMDSQEEISRSDIKGAKVQALAIQADGPLIAIGGGDGAVMLWNPDSNGEVQVDQSSPIPVRALTFPEGGRLCIARGTTVELRDVESGTQSVLETSLDTISTLAVDKQGKVVTVGNDEQSQVLVFESDSQKLIHELDKS
ncbi:MAG: HEAT repeat domain-containing protein [Planctomycetaceae bacterium]|nr:HEAT repeat domain-containing protein [Planctomycetaceae bacterium]